MTESIQIHPDRSLLAKYVSGQITDQSCIDSIEAHFSTCQNCLETAITIEPSAFELRIHDLAKSNTSAHSRLATAYEVIEELGRGGSGIVYRAHQPGVQREVALKMLISGANSSQPEIARFRREAAALARMAHPNIVTIYDCGEQDGLPFIAMELVAGPNLRQWSSERQLSARQIAIILESLCDAISVAHAQGIVHRDLKPQNILVAAQNDEALEVTHDDEWYGTIAKITDFGLTRFDDDEFRTRSGQILGTPAYMAPEIACGKSEHATEKTDIYGLGAILYECLTGRPPFTESDPGHVLHAICQQDPTPIRVLRHDVPVDLQTICDRCLEKDPGKRFPTATELKQDLRRFIDGHPIVSRPVSRIERGLKWIKRNPLAASLAAVVACSIGIIICGTLWHQSNLALERDVARANYDRARDTVWKMLDEVANKSIFEVDDLDGITWRQTEHAMNLFEFLSKAENTTESARDLANIRARAGTILVSVGKYDEGFSLLQQAQQFLSTLLDRNPENQEYVSNYISVQVKLAATLVEKQRNKEAADVLLAVLALANSLHSQSKGLVGPDQVAWISHNLGNARVGLNQHVEAIENYQASIDSLKETLSLQPDNQVARRRLAESQVCQALCLSQIGKNAEAESAYQDAIKSLEEIYQSNSNDTATLISLGIANLNLSNVQASTSRATAVESLSRGIGFLEMIIQQEPNHFQARSYLAMLYGNRAMYGSSLNPEQGLQDFYSAIEYATDDETRTYLKTMSIRQEIEMKKVVTAIKALRDWNTDNVSNANLFRIAALWALVANELTNSPESTTLDADQVANIIDVGCDKACRLLEDLCDKHYFAEDPAARQHVLEHSDFTVVRQRSLPTRIKH